MYDMKDEVIDVYVSWDEDAHVYYAVSEGIGLALESESQDKLIRRVKEAVPELLELNNIAQGKTICIYIDRVVQKINDQ